MSTDGPVTLITSGHVPDDAAVASVPALRAAGRHFGEDLLLASCVDSTPLAHAAPATHTPVILPGSTPADAVLLGHMVRVNP